LIVRAAHSPIYAVFPGDVGRGAVGGYVFAREPQAAKIAEMALQVAGGTLPLDIPLEDAPDRAVFDWRELRRWGIAEDKLPPSSVILFREVTFWEQFKWRIIAVLALCLLQTLLIGKLLVERRSRRKASEDLAQLNCDLECRMAEIADLSGRLISAQEDERRRISRELHDDLSQQSAGLGIRLSLVKRKLSDVDAAREGIAAVESGLLRLNNSVHALSHELHPALLERAGLGAALRAHCEECEEVNKIRIHLTVEIEGPLPSDVALCLYRIVQESLRNVVKHSGASEAWVSVVETDGQIGLTIEDCGRGFDPKAVGRSGIGLASMKERARSVGASFELESRAGGGAITRVVAPVPVRLSVTV
jgi:signal transduction histidine kinase